jgi:long-chain acyl-CoA synthetase
MPPDLLRWYARLGLVVVEVYGMTENCGVSHCTLPGKPRPGTVGYPYEGVLSRLDPDTDEVQVKSPGSMLGYYLEPDLTREAFTEDGWLRTGDKGVIDAEGGLRITGRVKDIFKTGKGKYVAPAPIEDRLVMHSAVEACCVTGANLGQPLAIVMLNVEAAQRVADRAQRKALEESLAAHMGSINALLDPHERLDCMVVVRQPWTVESGLITPTFKVRRNRVEDVYGQYYERWVVERRTVIWHEG